MAIKLQISLSSSIFTTSTYARRYLSLKDQVSSAPSLSQYSLDARQFIPTTVITLSPSASVSVRGTDSRYALRVHRFYPWYVILNLRITLFVYPLGLTLWTCFRLFLRGIGSIGKRKKPKSTCSVLFLHILFLILLV